MVSDILPAKFKSKPETIPPSTRGSKKFIPETKIVTNEEKFRFKSVPPSSIYRAKDIKGPQVYPKMKKEGSPERLKSKVKPTAIEVNLGKNSYKLPGHSLNPSSDKLLPVLSNKNKSKTTLNSMVDTERSQETN